MQFNLTLEALWFTIVLISDVTLNVAGQVASVRTVFYASRFERNRWRNEEGRILRGVVRG
jgi:hypothetical protein